MSTQVNISAISQSLDVKKLVLIRLRDIIPFEDLFNFIVNSPSKEIFWNLVDALPMQYSMPLHGIDISIETSDRDFPEGSIGPILQDFWAAHCLSANKQPTTTECTVINKVSKEILEEALNQSPGWSINENSYQFGEISFEYQYLASMCEAFASDGSPWYFFPDSSLRAAFIEAEKIINSSQRYPEINFIHRKMREFSYYSADQLTSDLIPLVESGTEISIPEFNIGKELFSGLRDLLSKASSIINGTISAPEIGPVDEWASSRSAALLSQMSLPLQQRSAYIITPNILQARAGMIENAGFEPGSLAELLLSDKYGHAVPLPYSSCEAQIPASCPQEFITACMRKFASIHLLKAKFSNVSDTALDIIADNLIEIGQQIGQAAITSVSFDQENDKKRAIANELLHQLNFDVSKLN